MSGRPEILFKLFGDVTTLDGVGPKTGVALEKAGICKPRDVLLTLPGAVIDRRLRPTLKGLQFPMVATVEVQIGRHDPPSRKGRPYRVFVRDAETEFLLVFFRAHAEWIRRMLPVDQRRIVSGRVELFDGVAQMAHPDHILTRDQTSALPKFEPVYPLTAGITQKGMRRAALDSVSMAPNPAEWIDPALVQEKNWPSWKTALEQAHHPVSAGDVSPNSPARERLAYDEFLAHQATLAIARQNRREKPGVASVGGGGLRGKVLNSLPFSLTGAQFRAVAQIVDDLAARKRMNRLLQGDVGSGKTLVALMAALAVVEAGGQAAVMAPTEILARQHLFGLTSLAASSAVRIDILTGRDKSDSRRDKLERLASGQIDILVGTHALFQKDVVFQDLRLAVVDEQHRFGVRQRMDLGQKGEAVDILVMTATPIPRSLELAHFGDMDLSVLDEKPPGRQPIETVLVPATRLDAVVERLKTAISEGRQAYWVCPLVEESEVTDATAAEARFATLRASFGEEKVALLHGQMTPADKDAAMAGFVAGCTRLLVATTVIEVGVDVPNASIMVIEGAEKFGLSQLHQLRGRVGRGEQKSTCLLMYDPPLGQTAEARLRIMRDTEDGFLIAEEDLRLRGAGDVLGVAQSGLPRFRIADSECQTSLMQTAQKDARVLLSQDPMLASPRGQALRVLLYLMDQDKAFQMMSVG